MELLLILIYTSICIVIFKVFRIPVNQWSLSTAVLGGVVGIALLVIAMAYNHPFSTNARIYFAVTPVYAGVRGRCLSDLFTEGVGDSPARKSIYENQQPHQ